MERSGGPAVCSSGQVLGGDAANVSKAVPFGARVKTAAEPLEASGRTADRVHYT